MSETAIPQEAPGVVPWPNQTEVVDGVVPASEVPQDPDLYEGDEDLDAEFEDEESEGGDEL